MVGDFLQKMGVDSKCKNPWKNEGKGHKEQRAVIVNQPSLLEGTPGTILLPSIEVKNNTHWGWKQGVFLGMDDEFDIEGMPIEVVHIPITGEVKG